MHNHTAYAPEDVDDARRGTPAFTLEAWAAQRGLNYPGPGLSTAFLLALPEYAEYVFNSCRGELTPGRYGHVAHELHEVEAHEGSLRAGGSFYGTRLVTRRGWKSFLHLSDDRPPEPFAANAAWAPTTKLIIRLPETVLLPRVVIRNSERIRFDHPDLAPAGLPGFRMAKNDSISADMLQWLGQACAPLGSVGASYVALMLDHGLLAISRNGFLGGEALDRFVQVGAAVAERLGAHDMTQASFANPLPQPRRETWPGHLALVPHEVEAFGRLAATLRLEEEDAVALHQTFRQLPFPGLARAVLRGTIPGTSAQGRVIVVSARSASASGYRTVVLLPARPDASTPIGGTLDKAADTFVEVAGGVAAAWPRVRAFNGFDSQASIERAVTTLRKHGLVDA